MKVSKKLVMVVAVLGLFWLGVSAETKKLKEVGRFTFVRIKGEVPTSEVMKILIEKYTTDIKYGLDLAGCGELFFPFIDQIKQASFVEKEMAIGEKFLWMFFRSQGQIKIVKDLEWAGDAPLPVFAFSVLRENIRYEFVMPRPCGNIALVRVEEIIPDSVCDIQVYPAKANIDDPITIDTSGSRHAASVEVEILDAGGSRVDGKTLTPDSPQWQKKFNEPGEYRFRAKAYNPAGKPSQNPCEAKTYINHPPVCQLTSSCLPCDDYVGKPIILDASQSLDSDGEVVRADFEIRDESGLIIDTFSDSDRPLVWEKIFNKPGLYTVTAVVRDDFGAMSEPCKIELAVTQKKFFFLVEAGPLLARGTYTMYFYTRAGFTFYIVPEKYSLSLTAGPAFPLTNSHVFKTFFMVNGLFNVHLDPLYFGAGLGYTSRDQETRQSGLDLLGNVGMNLFSNRATEGSLFFEIRIPVGSERPFNELHKLLLGFRLNIL